MAVIANPARESLGSDFGTRKEGEENREFEGRMKLVLESPVQSGLLPIFGKTDTETGL